MAETTRQQAKSEESDKTKQTRRSHDIGIKWKTNKVSVEERDPKAAKSQPTWRRYCVWNVQEKQLSASERLNKLWLRREEEEKSDDDGEK